MKILLFATLMAVSSIANAMHGVNGAHFSADDRGDYYHGDYHGGYYGDRGGYYNAGGGVSVDLGVVPGINYWNDPNYPYDINETNNYVHPMY